MHLARGGVSTGNFRLDGDTLLAFRDGTHTLESSASLSGDGIVHFMGGTVNSLATYNIADGTQVSGGSVTWDGPIDNIGRELSISGGTVTFNDAAVLQPENITLTSGTVNFNSDVTTNSLTQTNGTLDGNGSITTKTFEWTAGRHDGSGATIVTEQLRISGSRDKHLDERTLINQGTGVWLDNGRILTYNGSTWTNTATGTLDIQGDGNFQRWGGNYATFNNDGTIIKSAGVGESDVSYFDAIFNNRGTVEAQAGVIRFDRAFVNVSGTLLETGGVIDISGTFTEITPDQLPDLRIDSTTAPASGIQGNTVSVSWTVKNAGNEPTSAAPWYDAVFLSADETLGFGDISLGQIAPTSEDLPLASGERYTLTHSLMVPGVAAGEYFLLFVTDKLFDQLEANETNNIAIQPIQIEERPPENQQPTAAEDQLTATYNTPLTIAIDGPDGLLANDTDPDGDVLTLTSFTQPVQGTLIDNQNGTLTYTPPTDFLGTDSFVYTLSDGQGNSDSAIVQFAVQPPVVPDLRIEDLTAAISNTEPLTVTLHWDTLNAGLGSTSGTWQEQILVENTTTGEVVIDTLLEVAGAIAVGDRQANSLDVSLPGAGRYRFQVLTDASNGIFEFNNDGHDAAEQNNSTTTELSIDGPDLVVASSTATDELIIGNPAAVEVAWTIQNQGETATTDSWSDRIVLSRNTTIGDSDDIDLGQFERSTALLPGASYSQTQQVTLPNDLDGQFFLYIVADAANTIIETDGEDNNQSGLQPINVTIPYADLVIDATVTGDTPQFSGEPITLTWQVTNDGIAATTVASWSDRVVLSEDATLDSGDLELDRFAHQGGLGVNETYAQQQTILLPEGLEGEYTLFIVADTEAAVGERSGDQANNVAVLALTLELAPVPDLAVSDITAPTQVIGDPSEVTIGWTVTNVGAVAGTVDTWVDRIIASTDEVVGDGDDIILAEFIRNGLLAAGEQYRREETFLLPSGLDDRYQLFVQTDATSQVFENLAEANNAAVFDQDFDVMPIPYADLVIESATSDATGRNGEAISVAWTIANRGIGLTNDSDWNDIIRLATDPEGENIVATLGSFGRRGVLAVGDTYSRTAEVTLPYRDNANGDLAGTYYVVVETASGTPYEFIYKDNNRRVVSDAIEVSATPLPDLVVTDIQAPEAVQAGDTIDVFWTVRNDAAVDTAVLNNTWTDTVYLQDINNLNASPFKLESFTYRDGLEGGKSYTRSEVLKVPKRLQGQYQVLIETNAGGSSLENTGNNTTADDDEIAITLPDLPDLQVKEIFAPAQITAGSTFDLEFEVANLSGVATNSSTWQDRIYLSPDPALNSGAVPLATLRNDAALGPNETYRSRAEQLVVPKRFRGQSYIIIKADVGNTQDEYPQEGNNILVQPVDVIPLDPSDLVTGDVVAPDQAFEGERIQVRYTVTNAGIGKTERNGWTDAIWLTRDKDRPSAAYRNSLPSDINDYLLGTFSHNGSLDVGESRERVVEVTLPQGVFDEFGEWYITPWTDAYDVIAEDTRDININPDDPNDIEGNNYKSRPITVLENPVLPADLVVTSVIPVPQAFGGEPFTVEWTVKNQGSGATPDGSDGLWSDTVFLSDKPTFDAQNPNQWSLGSVPRLKSLEAGESYTNSATFDLTPAAAGQYIIVKAGPFAGEIPFVDNNTLTAETDVTNLPSDLQVIEIVTPEVNFSGEQAVIEWTVQNTGATVWDGTQYWIDEIYLSADPRLTLQDFRQLRRADGSDLGVDPLVGEGIVTFEPALVSLNEPLGTGETYTISQEVTLPRGTDGNYYIYINTATGSPLEKLPTGGSNDGSRRAFKSTVHENSDDNLALEILPIQYREPDLQVTDLIVPPEPVQSGETISVQWTVTNVDSDRGRDTREHGWIDRVYLSHDGSLDENDVFLGEFVRQDPSQEGLAKGDSYDVALDVALPNYIEGEYNILVFTDSNIEPPRNRNTPLGVENLGEGTPFSVNARVREYQDEGNNVTAAGITITPITPPDLQVTAIDIPERGIPGQEFDVTFTVANLGAGTTISENGGWIDHVYLSRDELLDPFTDFFLGSVRHGDIASGEAYTQQETFKIPNDLIGPYYVLVSTDSPWSVGPNGNVFEADRENNNISPSPQPLIIELLPASDLVAEDIVLPGFATTGDNIQLSWTVANRGDNAAEGQWTDAVYLSEDSVWDVEDRLIGRVDYEGLLAPGEFYTSTLDTDLPPVLEGQYRVIVRPDIFNQVYEADLESNNRMTSAQPLNVSVETLQLGVPFETTLSAGQDRLFKVVVDADQTLQVDISSAEIEAYNELFLRFNDQPSGSEYDAAYDGAIAANQSALIPTTEPGTYYVLARGLAQPDENTPVTLLADVLPFQITDVESDRGGDGRYVTTTISGAQFHPDAIVKLVRPGIAEYEPEEYEVIDSTEIIAVFDLTDAPHGLYDVKVINPDGQTAIVPYRYLVERAIETDVTLGLGGPRVLSPGEAGLYGISIESITNIDTPYVHFQFGIPELGNNDFLLGHFDSDVLADVGIAELPYITLPSNLRGAPPNTLQDLPWAELIPDTNQEGQNLAPGYIYNLPTQEWAGLNFVVQTYPGLEGLLERQPDVVETLNSYRKSRPPVPDDKIAFQYYVLASATALTREEFMAQQTAEALRLRDAILTDEAAAQALTILAADEALWVDAYLTALEEAGLLRPEEEAPPARENPLMVSLMATLTTGLLIGPAGESITSDGDLVSFFEQVRTWYGHDPEPTYPEAEFVGGLGLIAEAPDATAYDLETSRETHFVAFNGYVPFAQAQVDLPPFLEVPEPDFAQFFDPAGGGGELVTLSGPQGYGAEAYLPQGVDLPYTIDFANPANASTHVSEIRIVSELDEVFDPLQLQLGDLQVGDIQVQIPAGRGSFQGDFDFIEAKGFILRVSAGLDASSNTLTWLLQAIDPETGEVSQNPEVGLLPPNDLNGSGQGVVSYSVRPQLAVASGTQATAQARVILDNLAPQDTEAVVITVDNDAPTTEITVERLAEGGSDYRVEWSATDGDVGSGVKHVTVYVAEDGGDFKIWKRQTTDTFDVYQGEAGHTYEFMAIATDNAGNQETPTIFVSLPDDGSTVNVGTLPDVGATTEFELPPAPPPAAQQPSNPLFLEAEQQIPASEPTRQQSEFEQVLRPFVAQSFATGIGPSHGDIGPMAIAIHEDGSVLASGGAARNQLFSVPLEGGDAGAAIATLPYPIYDLHFGAEQTLWATTGGGPLLQLDAATGEILEEYGDGLTQTLAIDPATSLIYVSSGNGIEIFDPATATFSHYSDLRVGNLAFDPDGNLWAARWPERGDIVRFNAEDEPELVLAVDAAVDSLAFGVEGTDLEGLLFVSQNRGQQLDSPAALLAVDLATMRQVNLAEGGSRGDIVRTTADGRVLLSQSHQIDVISPLLPPEVAFTNPPPDAIIPLPQDTIAVTFDQDMVEGDPEAAKSVLNSLNYVLTGGELGDIHPDVVRYDADSRTAFLTFGILVPDQYELRVEDTVESLFGLSLNEDYTGNFQAISDFSTSVDIQFSDPRSHRDDQTISYEVTITNTADEDLQIPVMLLLQPEHDDVTGQPTEFDGRGELGAYLIDLSDELPDGRLGVGETTTSRTITIFNPDNLRVDFDPDVFTLPIPNQAPVVFSDPLTTAVAGESYSYQIEASDPENSGLGYLLLAGPEGLTVDADTGLIQWQPTTNSPAATGVTVRVYDGRGGSATQSFAITVEGGNTAPVMAALPPEILDQEGSFLQLPILVSDEEGDPLTLWADNLPPEATFNPQTRVLEWTPDFEAAGTYEDVTFTVSDGVNEVSQVTTLTIRPVNQSPHLTPIVDHVVQEGELARIKLTASDPEGAAVTYSSPLLPGGATLHPETGLFEWQPAFFQAGEFTIPLEVSDGTATTTETVTITVLNANAAPEFDDLGSWEIREGQELSFQAFAFDPDNPTFVPQTRLADGSLTVVDGGALGGLNEPSVSYAVTGLPEGASFDLETAEFSWTPAFDAAGAHTVTITATDDGNGTGTPATATIEVPVTVLNTNRPPTIVPLENQTIQRGETLELLIQTADPDDNNIVLSAASALEGFGLPDFATFTDQGDGTALLRFEPGFNDRGDYPITLTSLDDGDGGGALAALTDEYSFVVSVEAPNEPPGIVHIGDQVALVGETLAFDIQVSDRDEDGLTFEAANLPAGATLTPTGEYGVARFTWTPTAAAIGTYPIAITVTDSGNGDATQAFVDEQSFNIVVRSTNQAPTLEPVDTLTVTEGETLSVALGASDPDGDALTYRATNLPAGASLDPATGVLTWTPTLLDAGEDDGITVAVSDGNQSVSQTLTIQVNNANQAPVLFSLPEQVGYEDRELRFALFALDFDNDPLTYTPLAALPAGASFDPDTQQFSWRPGYEQAGEYILPFAVQDLEGASSEVDFTLRIENVNRVPELTVLDQQVALGETLAFPLLGRDPDANTTLIYGSTELPEGATLDAQTGEFSWIPGPGQIDDYAVTFTVSDGEATTAETILLRTTLTPELPDIVVETTPSYPANPGEAVIIHAAATAISDIAAISIQVDGEPLTLDDKNRGYFTADQPGRYEVTVTATDTEGRVGTTTSVVRVQDPTDTEPPVVGFSPLVGEGPVTAIADIVATVADASLDEWVLEIRKSEVGSRNGDAPYIPVATGTNTTNNNVLAQLDPEALPNGFYQLRLKARDLSDRTSSTETFVEINSAAKGRQYERQETDLSVLLGGTTVALTRRYQSLAPLAAGSLGQGWQLLGLEGAIQTNVPPSDREHVGVYSPFEVGTRLYVTLPEGDRVGYTFTPEASQVNGVTYYRPMWVPDAGVSYALASVDAVLTLAGDRVYDLETGSPYNPASGLFEGHAYTLTGTDGTQYHLNAEGDLRERVTPTGDALFFSDSGIVSPTGEAVQFTRNEAGHLTAIVAPDGQVLHYDYDAAGNLTSVRDLAAGSSRRYGYDYDAAGGRLTLVASQADPGAVIVYDAGQAPAVLPVTADLGSATRFIGQTKTGTLAAGQTDRYSFSVRESEVGSTATERVLLGVEVLAQPGSGLQPTIPEVEGLKPIAVQVDNERAYALFAVDQAGLQVLEVSSAGGAGAYELQLSVAGDVNEDGFVNGLDSQQMLAVLGLVMGAAGFIKVLDGNRDDQIDATDMQLLGSNFGFAANRAPQGIATEQLTHEELEIAIPLGAIAEDTEGDDLFYRVINPVNGSVALSPDGQSAVFVPTAGYAGKASFQALAEDGFEVSAPIDVPVNVSDAPLIGLEILNRNPRLDIGEGYELTVIGDFADQSDVLLPGSYLDFAASEPSVLAVNEAGVVTGLAAGNSILTVERGAIGAFTAAKVGPFTEPETIGEFQQFVIDEFGMVAFPQAVVVEPGASSQLAVGSQFDLADLTSEASGTRYFVSNADILTVSEDGQVTALQAGSATVTAINGASEVVIPVRVEAPQLGPVVLGPEGGIVQGIDGALVQLGEGVLSEATTTSIEALTQADLSLPIPAGFDYVGAFELELGDEALNAPAHLVLPVPEDLAPGTAVYLMHASELPDETGTWNPIWLQTEAAIVGEDGTIRTQPTAWSGVTESGVYAVLAAADVVFVRSQPEFTFTLDVDLFATVADGFAARGNFIAVPESTTRLELLTVPEFGAPIETAIGVRVVDEDGEAAGETLSASVLAASLGGAEDEGLVVSTEGPVLGAFQSASNPARTVELRTDRINEFEVRIDAFVDPDNDPSEAPVISQALFEFDDTNTPTVVLGGEGFGSASQGSDTLKVEFLYGDSIIEAEILQRDGDNVTVQVPDEVALSASQIRVKRLQESVIPSDEENYVVSKTVRIENLKNDLVFVTTDDHVSVLNRQGEKLDDINELARIRLEDENGKKLFPLSIDIAPDQSRAYAVVPGAIAVIDTVALQQMDAIPDAPDTVTPDLIYLPDGVAGYHIAIDKQGKYAYVTDIWWHETAEGEKESAIHVIDIDPTSATYHEYVQSIKVGPALAQLASLEVSSDGKLLFVTAPNRDLSSHARDLEPENRKPGHVVVINIDPADRDKEDGRWHEQIAAIPAHDVPYGLSAASDPNKLLFTNARNDDFGVGVLDITNSNPKSFEANIFSYTSLNIGDASNFNEIFDVNNAVDIVALRGGTYAFVLATNVDGTTISPQDPSTIEKKGGGANIGIIKDPFSVKSGAQLVAATRQIPFSDVKEIALSPDEKYLYVTHVSGGGQDVYVYDVREIISTVESNNPNLSEKAINDENSKIDIRANYQHISSKDADVDFDIFPTRREEEDGSSKFRRRGDWRDRVVFEEDGKLWDWVTGSPVFGIPAEEDANKPIDVGNQPRSLSIIEPGFLTLEGPVGIHTTESGELILPTFAWDYSIPESSIQEVNLFISVFPENEGLLPSDALVDFSEDTEDKHVQALRDSGLLSEAEIRKLLSKNWRDRETDFNPNRILTATWTRDGETGQWVLPHTSETTISQTDTTSTSFTLSDERALTSGQTYYWAVEAVREDGNSDLEFGEFQAFLEDSDIPDNTFSSVSFLAHGFQFESLIDNIVGEQGRIRQGFNSGLTVELYEAGADIVEAGGNGLLLRYEKETGYWIPVNRNGQVLITDKRDVEGLKQLYSQYYGKPIVLLADWAEESIIPNSGFTEAAADAFFASLVNLDQWLGGSLEIDSITGSLEPQHGAIFNSPLHIAGLSRGSIVASELVQRIGTYFPNAGGTDSENRDLQLTLLDPHDFNQPSIDLVTLNFGDFYEPKVQIWDNVTFADNYFQTVPALDGRLDLNPSGRNIPDLPYTEED